MYFYGTFFDACCIIHDALLSDRKHGAKALYYFNGIAH